MLDRLSEYRGCVLLALTIHVQRGAAQLHVVLGSVNFALRINRGVRFVCSVAKRKDFRLLINRGRGLSHRNQRRKCPSKEE